MKLSEFLEQQAKAKKQDGKPAAPSARTAVSHAPEPSKKTLKVLRARETPNPNALQYVLNAQALSYGNKSYASKADCAGDEMGTALFDLNGVISVYVMDNFVTVTKAEETGWSPLRELAWKCIDKHVKIYSSDGKQDLGELAGADYRALSSEEKLKAVEAVLNRSIRSSLARDGGGVELKGIEGDDVLIHYQGACGSCPSSTTGTLKHIEKLLQQQLHPDLKVRSV
ncbi:MAG: NifU family protein [Nitrospinae bacterium]|nr:NifU family protein [Nitrospinota bacterium]